MLHDNKHTFDAVSLLKGLIAIPSFSKEEQNTASLIENYLQSRSVKTERLQNNIYALNQFFDPKKPTLLLNSHHDTVRPSKGYTIDPFTPKEDEGKLMGLGSNDAGGALVALIETFLHFFDHKNLPFNLIIAASAEEEISGPNGVELLLNNEVFHNKLAGSKITGALVGEPTKMEMAVAERGLLVLDAVAEGKAGHAARQEGINAIMIAHEDINTIASLQFGRESELTGKTTAQVTVIETDNKAHNVVPSSCRFVIDVRVNEKYNFEEIIDLFETKLKSKIRPRSFRLRSTMMPMDHPFVMAGKKMGWRHYGSPTTSDKALMPFPALKIGPGDSSRSHTADEYIYIDEIAKGIDGYIRLLEESGEYFKDHKS